MMRILSPFLIVTIGILINAVSSCSISNHKPVAYRYAIDLNEMKEGQIAVGLENHLRLPDTVTFFLPKMVPGIYDEMNFGQYLSHLIATDKKGRELRVEQLNTNAWRIFQSTDLHALHYTIQQGWSAYNFDDIRPYVSAEAHLNDSLAILNANALFGYFEGHREQPIQVQVKHPSFLYGSTSLNKQSIEETDIYSAKNYRHLVDNPIFYALPDTASFQLPSIKVNVACHSTTGKFFATELAQFLEPLVRNQSEYLNGQLQTDYYSFLMYHEEYAGDDGSYMGEGLEHSQSTVILLHSPFDLEVFKNFVYSIASHEFFHTLLPLSLHSHEIAQFDFNAPQLSQHLWLYEGTTEYFTIHMPIKQGLITEEVFYGNVEEKIRAMQRFNQTLSITELSKEVVKHQDQYMNVYHKGALINLCLEILLLEATQGKMTLVDLILNLSKQFGKDQPFDDNLLFEIITKQTSSERIRQFLLLHVQGNEPLPLVEILAKVGLQLTSEGKIIDAQENHTPEKLQLRSWWLKK